MCVCRQCSADETSVTSAESASAVPGGTADKRAGYAGAVVRRCGGAGDAPGGSNIIPVLVTERRTIKRIGTINQGNFAKIKKQGIEASFYTVGTANCRSFFVKANHLPALFVR